MKTLEEILQIDLIKNKLANLSHLTINKKAYQDLSLINNKEQLIDILLLSKEVLLIFNNYNDFLLIDFENLNNCFSKLEKGSYLLIEQFHNLRKLLLNVITLKKHFKTVDFKKFPLANNKLNNLINLDNLLHKINEIINEDLTIKDNASLALKNIRLSIKENEKKINDQLKQIIKKNNELLKDNNIYFKNGRYTLAVDSSNKYKLSGVIIDESTTRLTTFIEPEAIYKINLEIQKLKSQENDEIINILKSLSELTLGKLEEIKTNYFLVIKWDFYMAKARFAKIYNAQIATINNNEIKLIGARHPLINQELVVANDFILNKEIGKILIISGPNAGGKTIALKTIAILAYMNQLGLPISVDSTAILPVFDNIYADIGDEQSIENSLSTFTSHINNITKIINYAKSNSLIVLDEIGSGTNPKEGEALAMAIISHFMKTNNFLLTTTHYENLKTFALENENINLSAMGFNKEKITPTYKLLINESGNSYAFEIAKRQGLNKVIINKAEEFFNKYASNELKTIKKLEVKLSETETKLLKLQEKELSLLQKEQHLQQKLANFEKETIKIKNELIEATRKDIDLIIQELKEKENLKKHHELLAKNKLDQLKVKTKNKDVKQIFKIGDFVKVLSLNEHGEIISLRKDVFTVQTKNITIKTKNSDLMKIKRTKKDIVYTNVAKSNQKVSNSINLVGYRVYEALNELDSFINQAVINKLDKVSIIHGVGTGKLAKGIHEYLKKSKFNLEYNYDIGYYGSKGVTIVTFKSTKEER